MASPSITWTDFSATAFRHLCRDMLAAHLGTDVECFGDGPDGGVDLRAHQGRTVIQCKRFTTSVSRLMSALKEEAEKKAVRDAERYMVMTTQKLTDADRTRICALFPAMRSTSDILDAEDLEHLLRQHPRLRKLYPQLWLGDKDFIRALLKEERSRAEATENAIETEAIIEAMQCFALPPQAEKAAHILRDRHALIITGAPGEGKTTLARYLAWQLMVGEGYEIVVVRGAIDATLPLRSRGVKQLFLCDDFLGATFIHDRREKNERRQLTAFLARVQASPDKRAIFTTREYIFRQAQLQDSRTDEAESPYTPLLLPLTTTDLTFRARLLHRHLQHADIPPQLIETLFYNARGERWGEQPHLLRILQHGAFNPRLIATALAGLRDSADFLDFPRYLSDALDNPYFLYENAFTAQLMPSQRRLLLTLATFPDRVPQAELFRAAVRYDGYAEAALRPTTPEEDLHVLIGDFLTSELHAQDEILIRFVNPGVRDFMHRYLERHPSVYEGLLCVAESSVQLIHLAKILRYGKLSFPACTKEMLSMRAEEYLREQLRQGNYAHEMAQLLNLIPFGNDSEPLFRLTAELLRCAANEPNFIIPDVFQDDYHELISLLMMNDSLPKLPWDAFFNAVMRGSDRLTVFAFVGEFDKLFSPSLTNPDSPSPAAAQWWDNYMGRMEYAELDETEDELQYFEECYLFYKPRYCGIDLEKLHEILKRCLRYERAESGLNPEDGSPMESDEIDDSSEPEAEEPDMLQTLFEPLSRPQN